jgi:capsid protein
MLEAAQIDRLLGTWGVTPGDPNDQYGLAGKNIAARGEHLYDNDAVPRAIVESILSNSIGPSGLQFRSIYQANPEGKLTAKDQRVRRQIEKGIKAGTREKRFDAGGMMTRATMSKVVLASCINDGMGISIRESKPNRPGRPSHSSCWRIIHPLRLSNPGFGPNNQTYRDGFELDADRNPIAVHVQRTHPNTIWNLQKFVWDRVPLYDALGFPNVTIHAQHRIADQVRPVGWWSPVMQLMRLFGRTLQAKVVADTLKASMGLLVECMDPAAAAAADQNGAVLGPNTKIVPGKCYYFKVGTKVTPLDFDYKGDDFDKCCEVILTNICAAFQIPYEYIMMRLTKSNMASSRVALAQAYRTFHGFQEDLIASTESVWNESLIREDVVRGRIDIPMPEDYEDWDGVFDARYLRPAKHMPDPKKEADAAVVWTGLGKSLSTTFSDAGMDLDDELPQRQRDNAAYAAAGVSLNLGKDAPAEDADGADEDGNDDQADEAQEAENTDADKGELVGAES